MSEKVRGYKFNLNSSVCIRKMLSKIASELYEGKIDSDRARCMTYIANTAISCLKTIDVEDRLDELEKHIESGK